jgi:hypothetical protein
MGFLVPRPPDPQPLPRVDRGAAEEARRKQRELAKRMRGRASTILTGGQGVRESAPAIRKQLLGE